MEPYPKTDPAKNRGFWPRHITTYYVQNLGKTWLDPLDLLIMSERPIELRPEMPASKKKLRAERQKIKLGYRPVMGLVARAEGQVVFRGGRRDQGVGHAQAGGKSVFFHINDGPVTGVLGQGHCSEAELHLYDAQIAILMREHGIKRIYTRDTDFHRFSFLEPIDPTA